MENSIQIKGTWQGLLPAFIAVLQGGNEEGKTLAKKELAKLCDIADRIAPEAMKEAEALKNDNIALATALRKIAARKSDSGEKLSPVCMANIATAALAKVQS